MVAICAAIGFASLSAAGAGATTIVTTFHGTVLSGLDNLGLFGPVGSSLAGDVYTSVYTTNPLAAGDIVVNNEPYDTYIFGGAVHGSVSPTDETMSINGRSFFQSGIEYGEDLLSEYTHSGTSQIYLQAGIGDLNVTSEQIQSSVNLIGVNGNYQEPFSYGLQPGDVSFGAFVASAPTTNIGTNLSLMPTSVTVESIPEPVTWALILVGIGGLGAILRSTQSPRSALGLTTLE